MMGLLLVLELRDDVAHALDQRTVMHGVPLVIHLTN